MVLLEPTQLPTFQNTYTKRDEIVFTALLMHLVQLPKIQAPYTVHSIQAKSKKPRDPVDQELPEMITMIETLQIKFLLIYYVYQGTNMCSAFYRQK